MTASARSTGLANGADVTVEGFAAAAALPGAADVKPAVHQVLATLGYGDAIGNEVLGVQRVLRAAGYDSEIFVETADLRLEDLTLDYRDLPEASHPDNILLHHFSLGSRASRMAHVALRHRQTQHVIVMPAPLQAVLFRAVVAIGTVLGKYRGTDWPGCPARCGGAPEVED